VRQHADKDADQNKISGIVGKQVRQHADKNADCNKTSGPVRHR
jgi:hypothetical protein